MITFAGFIVSMMLTMVLMPLAKQMGYRFHIVDMPNQRKVHAIPIPRIGGVAIVMGAAAPLMIWLDLSRSIKGYLAGALVILVFGILDDRFELGYKLKFGAQFLAAVLAVVYGGVHFEQLHIFHHWMPFPEPFAIAVTCFFILAAVNAINFSDGLDGLAGGVVLISLSALIVLALRIGAHDIVLICAVLIGSILGFLLFNSHPAQIFMGDSGSQFLGYSLAILGVHLIQGRSDLFSTFLPVALIGLPIADVFLVIIARLLKGNNPFKPDRNHIHHRLMAVGLRQYGSVFVIYIIQGLIIGAVMVQRYAGDGFYVLFLPTVVLSITAVMLFIEKYDCIPSVRHINALVSIPERALKQLRAVVNQLDLARWSRLVSVSLITGYLLMGAVVATPVPLDVGVIAGALFVLLLIFQPVNITEKLSGWFSRFIYYLGASGVLFLMYTTSGFVTDFKPYMDVLFIVLALLILIGLEYSNDSRLNARPLDFLVVVTAFMLSGISTESFGGQLYWIVAIHLLVIFYGIELALVYYRNSRMINVIQILFALPLGVLMVRGILL